MMIKVYVKWMTENEKIEMVEIEENTSVGELLRSFEKKDKDYMVVINGKSRLLDHILQDEDEVKLFLLMAGG
ncbi:Sulfur carrier protein ThiS (thiamine biosynthesis) [Tindallia magadiensis]|uniref:Sulfur carrier protein ThiS (Thiamine biosynthesis) n=2 Tax=Tindallia magadiensis TaxID=69895 RepID=A0A1I3BC32_9FIRM|nr:Sulfur carrier protein ThiS (thiamine biosynthesis) [Tindallia magadiensis]